MVERNTYIIRYVAQDAKNQIIKHGTMRCKNRMSSFDAQAGLERFLEKKLIGFKKLTVLEIKIEDNNDYLDHLFKNLFKK